MEEEVGRGGVTELYARLFWEQAEKLLADRLESTNCCAYVALRGFSVPGLLFWYAQARHLGHQIA
jgi:hypothetical protein